MKMKLKSNIKHILILIKKNKHWVEKAKVEF